MARNAKLTPSVRLAVLGLLLERPSWGYELVARFERTFGQEPCEWRVTPPAIYGALRRLEEEDLIEPIGGEDGERWPDSKQRQMRQSYRVTGAGARSVRQWLATPMTIDPSREELLIRLHFGRADRDALGGLLRRHADVCLEELDRIASMPARTPTQRLLKEDRRLAVQARLSWIGLAPLLAPASSPSTASFAREAVLSVEHVSKHYQQGHSQVAALRDVSLVVESGEVVCVTGTRRSGRTTLLRIVASVEHPDEGRVLLAGIAASPDLSRQLVAACNVRFLPAHGRDACEHVSMPLLSVGVSLDQATLRAHRALEQVGGGDLAFTSPREWTPSEAVRVSLARAIVREPRLLIIDEPTYGVDPAERDPLLLLIQRIAHESGIATLLTAGDTTSVTGADRVLRLSDGELLGRPPSPAAEVVELRRPSASESSP